MMYKVRFHLARGKNYMKWQVRSGDSVVTYFDPEKYFFIMSDCKLINKKSIAKKIHGGANKSVCAWIECKNLEVIEEQYFNLQIPPEQYYPIFFNPKVKPFWENEDGVNIDNFKHTILITHKKTVLSREKLAK